MANTPDFWGRLGDALAEPQKDTLSTCGCDLGAGVDSVDASTAVGRMLAQYVAVTAQGVALQKIAALKIQVPCAIWTAYARARQDYLTKSQEILDQLKAKGITLEKVLYTAQGPKTDPGSPSLAETAQLLAPLAPPTFSGLDQQCPGIPNLTGALTGLGWERVPIQLSSVPLTALKPLGGTQLTNVLVLFSDTKTLIGVAAPAGYQAAKKVPLFPRPFSADLHSVTTYTSCFQAQGANAEANKRCAPDRAQRSTNTWKFVGLGALLLIVGGLFLRAVRRPTLAGVASDEVRSRPGEPILLGDLYWYPRTSGRRRI